jgi:hypothetical protein
MRWHRHFMKWSGTSALQRATAVMGSAAVLLVTSCAQPWQSVEPGADQSALVARLGPPRETYDLPGGGKRLMWPTQPMGYTTTADDHGVLQLTQKTPDPRRDRHLRRGF